MKNDLKFPFRLPLAPRSLRNLRDLYVKIPTHCFFSLFLLISYPLTAQFRQPLPENWKISPHNLSTSLPTTVQEAYYLGPNAPEPFDFYREGGEKAIEWMEKETWTFTTHFVPHPSIFESELIYLTFPCLDTYADLFLNGKPLGSADNYFREWKWEVKPWLLAGENELTVIFRPVVAEGKKAKERLGYELPAGNDSGAEKIAPYVRKPQFQFGWDWGPRIVTTGIRAIPYLEGTPPLTVGIHHFQIASLNDSLARIPFSIDIEWHSDSVRWLKWNIGDAETGKIWKTLHVQLSKGQQTLHQQIEIKDPIRWWPHSHGNPHLYNIYSELVLYEDGTPYADTFQIGLRTIELIREPDSIGESFYFKVNGQPIFMKGANYIPPSHLVSRSTFSEKQRVLDLAIQANMNMVRIWGGGEYETEEFYDYCDEKGLLVWQDMMFACSMYPGDSAFRKNIEIEFSEQLTRISRHPSLALVCGNNENEVAWGNWGWQQQFGWDSTTQNRIWQDYLYTFDTLLPKTVRQANVFLPYLRSSPSSNWGKIEHFDRGNMHYWGVWHGDDRFEDFRKYIPRFMSEYGFQSWPLASDLRPYLLDTEIQFESKGILERQKSYKGNAPILREMELRLGPPKNFDDFTLKSQQLQAIAYKMAIVAHRMRQPHCMGTLFWQLNDCWVGPSWSVIDGNGRPKLAYEAVKKAYAPILVTAFPNEEGWDIYSVLDHPTLAPGNLIWMVKSEMGKVLAFGQHPFSALPEGSTQLLCLNLRAIKQEAKKSPLFLELELILPEGQAFERIELTD